jgi:hypothetical protein
VLQEEMKSSVSNVVLIVLVFILAPFSLIGFVSFKSRPSMLTQQSQPAFHHVQVANPETSTQKTVTPVSPSTPSFSELPNDNLLWLPEIEGLEKVDLSKPEIIGAESYSLYKQPGAEWLKRAQEKVEPHLPRLKHALNHIHDPEQRITFVACLFDMGRDKLEGFERKFDEYINRFQRIIDLGFPMLIFMEGDKISKFNWDRNKDVMVIPFTVKDLVAKYPNYFDRIEEIRHSGLYKRQAEETGWLSKSPQASLKYYNLMVMTKLFMLRYAAHLNPHKTQYLAFLDAGHLCGPYLQKSKTNLLRKYMGKMMVTYFDYGAGLHGESHGMAQKAYRTYVGPPFDNPETWADEWCCRIVRGGLFGGTPAYIDAAAEAYNEILAQSLADGYMGTEENILGVTYYRFPDLFNAHKNVGGDNCAIFSASTQQGTDSPVYIHGSEADDWHI